MAAQPGVPVCLLLAGLCLTGPAHGGDYSVAVEALDYQPLYDGSHPPAYTGFARDLLDLFGRHYGHTFHYVPLPINRLFAEMYRSQRYDFKFPDSPRWQVEQKRGVIYSEPVLALTEGIFVPQRRLTQAGKPVRYIGILAGFSPTPYQAQIASGRMVVYPSNNFAELFRMRTVERVDGVYANAFAVRHFQPPGTPPEDRLVLARNLPYVTSQFCLATLKYPAVIAQFNRFLREQRDEISRLKQRYGVDEVLQQDATMPQQNWSITSATNAASSGKPAEK
ncbi:hypothetical protein SAMN02745857_00918 [Andreprevotia lacus DSM 23236]|jgi:hypothetical protein|uniref:Extracellular solute-binding protein, family 3 n=1 Tax=Andreprevotia lacus DSM 23236 TaxID=1121001 RepID=A0A1W1X8W3_9NEIS|nr:hypothetical protein [Andreprevotia lacus]SMC20359.1 hypothetical protein SAMN02745857_00918 [Andreprevotia lacus DSM 23236]